MTVFSETFLATERPMKTKKAIFTKMQVKHQCQQMQTNATDIASQ
jgi:hypothetical protein